MKIRAGKASTEGVQVVEYSQQANDEGKLQLIFPDFLWHTIIVLMGTLKTLIIKDKLEWQWFLRNSLQKCCVKDCCENSEYRGIWQWEKVELIGKKSWMEKITPGIIIIMEKKERMWGKFLLNFC